MVFIVVLLSLSQDKAFAGAWTVPKHKVWIEWYNKWSWSKEDFNDARVGDVKNNEGKTWGWTTEPKLEYGITDWLTFLCSLEYKENAYKEYDRPADWGPFRRKNNGVSSVKFGGRLRFLEEPVVLSGQMKVFIYPGYGNYNGDDPAYRHQPGIGDGDDALELRMLMGKSFDLPLVYKDLSLSCYAGAETGYRFRNRDVCNDIPFFFEAGFWPLEWLLIKGEIDGYIAHEATGSIKRDYAIWRVGPIFHILGGDTITKRDKQFNIEVQYGQTFSGRNTSKDQEIVIKFQTQF